MCPMEKREWLADQFEANRTRLPAVAYRMLGSLSEADDAVQESWLHISRSDTSSVENLAGWLTTIVARQCLDMLRSRKYVTRRLWIGIYLSQWESRGRMLRETLPN